MIRRGAMVLMVVAAVAAGTAHARPSVYPQTQARLNELVKAGAPGAVVLIRRGGSTTVFAAGLADRRTRRPMRGNDRFRVASITKSFVATIVLQLVAESKLSLSDTVEQLLPGLVPNGRRITVKELLQHTSGLYDYENDPRLYAPYLRGNLGYTWTPQQLVALAVLHQPLSTPGAEWSYSNTNYVILGLIVEAVTKHKLEDELSRRILRPVGLHATRFGADRVMGSPAAHGYYTGRDVAQLSFSFAWGAGSMVSTAADVARFYRALLGGKLLGPQQLKQMETTVPAGADDYGLGLWHRALTCGSGWGHPGLAVGYESFAWSSKDGRRQIVAFATTTTAPVPGAADLALKTLVETAFCAY